jgi:hypothetical protein
MLYRNLISIFIIQVQGNLSETAERADLNEQALAKMKARGRSMEPQ